MNEIKLKLNRRHLDLKFPSSWNELRAGELLLFCRLLLTGISPAGIRLRLSYFLIRTEGRKFLLKGQTPAGLFRRLSMEQKGRLSLLFSFLFKEISLTENKLFVLKAGRLLLYGPEDSFKNLRWNEFMAAEKYAEAYRQTENIEMLHYLSAVLYRPKRADYNPESPDFKGDIREDFNQHLIERRLLLVRQWSPETHLAIYFFYLGCRRELQTDYPAVFGEAFPEPLREESSAEEEAQNKKKEPSDFDWLDFLRHLPAPQFGTLEEIEKQQVHPVLYLADRMMKEAAKEKAAASRSGYSRSSKK